jgi:hypothetical protein
LPPHLDDPVLRNEPQSPVLMKRGDLKRARMVLRYTT